MTNIVVLPEVREAVAKAMYEHWRAVTMQGPPWEGVDENWRTGTLGQAEAAITALFEAWPMNTINEAMFPGGVLPCIMLPLTQEPGNGH